MRRFFLSARSFLFFFGFLANFCVGQAPRTAPASDLARETQHALELAKAGHCKEALPLLRKAALRSTEEDLKRKAGFAGVRCAMVDDTPDAAIEFLRVLTRDFPHDPAILYLSVHTYSDLSTRAAQELAVSAPNSSQAHELNAEALEMEGKWDEAEKEYATVLHQDPHSLGIHFRLGQLILSKPKPGPDMAERAKKEFQQELEIDPNNAGAEYVLGELARQESQWPEAIAHFSKATKLDATFGDAFLGLGTSLLSAKQFSEAIPPLQTAVKLEPQNPGGHYALAMAYSRAGRKQDADREFAVHKQMTQKGDDKSQAGSPQGSPN